MNVEVYMAEYLVDLEDTSQVLAEYKGIERQIIHDHSLISLYEKWKPKLGFDQKVIKTHLDRYGSDPNSEIKSSYTYKELMEQAEFLGDWIVPSFFQPGALYLWFGLGKDGKTTSALDLMYGVLISGTWLGFPVKKGKVLHFDLEQGVAMTAKKFKDRGFEDNGSVLKYSDVYRAEKKFCIMDDLPYLREYILDYKPTLVVIDSFRKSLSGTGIDENSPIAGSFMYALQSIFMETNTTGIMIHHANKTGKGVNGASGHSSLAAGNDGLIRFTKLKNPDGLARVQMDTFPREGVPRCFMLNKKTVQGGRWHLEIESEPGRDPNLAQVGKKVLRLMTQDTAIGKTWTRDEIYNELGFNLKDHAVDSALIDLQELSIINCRKSLEDEDFKYFIPDNSVWFSNNTSLNSFISHEAHEADRLVKCRNHIEVRKMVKDWTQDFKNSVFKLLSSDEKEKIIQLGLACPYEVGQLVKYLDQVFEVVEAIKEGKTYYFKVKDFENLVSEDDISIYVPEPEPQEEELLTIEEKELTEELW